MPPSYCTFMPNAATNDWPAKEPILRGRRCLFSGSIRPDNYPHLTLRVTSEIRVINTGTYYLSLTVQRWYYLFGIHIGRALFSFHGQLKPSSAVFG